MNLKLGSEKRISKNDIVEESREIIDYGIYFLISEDEVVYIGSSKSSCISRIKRHNKRISNFSSYCILPVDESVYLEEVETRFIYKFLPKLNRNLPFHGTITTIKRISQSCVDGVGRSKLQTILSAKGVEIKKLPRSRTKLVKRKPTILKLSDYIEN